MAIRKIHFSDNLEKSIAEALEKSGIDFIHESENKLQQLDFYLPSLDVYIEVKQYHSERISKQMSYKDNVIAVQGKYSVAFLIQLILGTKIN